MRFTRPVVVYVPCYNCEKTVRHTLSLIPASLAGRIECLVVDNHSTDNSGAAAAEAAGNGSLPFPVRVIRTVADLGYPGSQKLAYSLVCRSPAVEHVIMLHGDGQYPPELLEKLVPYIGRSYAAVQGYRDKKAFPRDEETPVSTYLIIKSLNLMESLLTGFYRKEWHSGFVMYRCDFIRKVPLQLLSRTRHIDGEFLLCAGILGLDVAAVPIYKRYKKFESFKGSARMKYIADVLGVIRNFRKKYYHRILASGAAHAIDDGWEALTPE